MNAVGGRVIDIFFSFRLGSFLSIYVTLYVCLFVSFCQIDPWPRVVAKALQRSKFTHSYSRRYYCHFAYVHIYPFVV